MFAICVFFFFSHLRTADVLSKSGWNRLRSAAKGGGVYAKHTVHVPTEYTVVYMHKSRSSSTVKLYVVYDV